MLKVLKVLEVRDAPVMLTVNMMAGALVPKLYLMFEASVMVPRVFAMTKMLCCHGCHRWWCSVWNRIVTITV